MNNVEPEFKSKELQGATVVKSSITALDKVTILPDEIAAQLQRYYAIKGTDVYKQFILGTLQGNKKQLSSIDLLSNLFTAISSYLTNLNDNESKTKIRIEKLVSIIVTSIQLLIETATPENSTVDMRTDVQALLLGILSKNL